jgi:hypothetical protein
MRIYLKGDRRVRIREVYPLDSAKLPNGVRNALTREGYDSVTYRCGHHRTVYDLVAVKG